MTPLVWVYTIQNTENSIPQIFTLSSFMMLPCARSAWSWSSHKLISNWLTPVTHHTLLCQHSKRKSKSLFLLQRQCYVICWSWQLADDWGTWFGGKKHTLSIIADLCHVSHTAAHVWFQATGLESHFLRLAACSKVAALCCLLELGNWQVSEPQDKLWFWLKDIGWLGWVGGDYGPWIKDPL